MRWWFNSFSNTAYMPEDEVYPAMLALRNWMALRIHVFDPRVREMLGGRSSPFLYRFGR
jgi:hypothetical protein